MNLHQQLIQNEQKPLLLKAGSDSGKAHEALAGPDPKPMQEDQTGSDFGKVHVSLAGPNPEHTDEEFLATAYPKVYENLKLITDEHVIEDNPESNSGSMSSMKNLEDTDKFGDQFLNDKPTEDCNTPKLGRSGIRVRGVLLHRSITQDIYRTTKKSFENDTLDLTK
ncbi:hypothetical protein Tco_0181427 [Tanacetum coccineum]